VPAPAGVNVYAIVRSGFPRASSTSRDGRSCVVIVTSYGLPPFTIANRDPSPIGSGLRNSALLTRLFHRASFRTSASVSNTRSGGDSIRVDAVTRMATMITAARQPGRVVPLRKVVAYELLSLDAVAEDPDRFITDWDEAMDANLAAVIAAQDAVILGRRSYDEWAAFWPGSEIQPFATFINRVTKYLATSAPPDQEWANTTVIDDGLVDFVRDLKNRPGGDIGVHASISVAQALLAADVVDELRLVIAPRIAGGGRRLLDGLPSIQLEAIRSVTSPTGHLLVDYRVIH
jgi:dihydrofolate reductase